MCVVAVCTLRVSLLLIDEIKALLVCYRRQREMSAITASSPVVAVAAAAAITATMTLAVKL